MAMSLSAVLKEYSRFNTIDSTQCTITITMENTFDFSLVLLKGKFRCYSEGLLNGSKQLKCKAYTLSKVLTFIPLFKKRYSI